MCNPDSQSWALHASEPDGRGLLDPNADKPRLKPARLIMGQHHFSVCERIRKPFRLRLTECPLWWLCSFIAVTSSEFTTIVLFFLLLVFFRQHVHGFLCLFLLPAPSSPSPTQPSRASSWQPLHTPRLSVSSRRRKRSNSALALGLYATVAAQPMIKEMCVTAVKQKEFGIQSGLWVCVYVWVFICL